MDRRILIAIGGLIVLIVGTGLGLHASLYRGNATDEFVSYRVSEGSSLRRVADDLAEKGLIGGAWQLRLVARLEGGATSIHAGDYEIPVGASPAEILDLLVTGRVVTVSVTLIEGWIAERAVEELAENLELDRDRLHELVAAPTERIVGELEIPEGHGLEGYLFPETYRFNRGLDEERILADIVENLRSTVLVDSVRQRMQTLDMTLHEVLTLASIVEAEAIRDDERPSIAAVYHNRLKKGWKLEADPTVAYAVGKIGKRLYFRDLEVDSPYNTYKVRGLPPGPINSPGLASILATLWPREDFDAMYFVADGQGGHHFSRTWEEHSAAVREYRRLMRERRAREAG